MEVATGMERGRGSKAGVGGERYGWWFGVRAGAGVALAGTWGGWGREAGRGRREGLVVGRAQGRRGWAWGGRGEGELKGSGSSRRGAERWRGGGEEGRRGGRELRGERACSLPGLCRREGKRAGGWYEWLGR
eukprot:3169393-Rhodomonas_salina.1